MAAASGGDNNEDDSDNKIIPNDINGRDKRNDNNNNNPPDLLFESSSPVTTTTTTTSNPFSKNKKNARRKKRKESSKFLRSCQQQTTTPTDNNNHHHHRAAYHKLHSLIHDVSFLQRTLHKLHRRYETWPLVSNKRCGTWYGYPFITSSSQQQKRRHYYCHFKSTDGHPTSSHVTMSFQRLNLSFLSTCYAYGGCFIVDASQRKTLPDSFSRTISVWCGVMNELIRRRLRRGDSGNDAEMEEEEMVWFPTGVVPMEEAERLKTEVIPSIVDQLESGNVLDVDWLLQMILGEEYYDDDIDNKTTDGMIMTTTRWKPLRPYWIVNNEGGDNDTTINNTLSPSSFDYDDERYTCLVCISCSNPHLRGQWMTTKSSTLIHHLASSSTSAIVDDDITVIHDDAHEPHRNDDKAPTTTTTPSFLYLSGALDDDECGNTLRGLTPHLFWNHAGDILQPPPPPPSSNTDKTTTDDDDVTRFVSHVNDTIDRIVRQYASDDENDNQDECCYSPVSSTGLHIGSRRAGRPTECFRYFDVILNVSQLEYDFFIRAVQSQLPSLPHVVVNNNDAADKEWNYNYLQLPIAEGKRDKRELERWLPLGVAYLWYHTVIKGKRDTQKRNDILIHCAQGRDRSVAVVMAFLCLFYNVKGAKCAGVGNGSSIEMFSWCRELTLEGLKRMIVNEATAAVVGDKEGQVKETTTTMSSTDSSCYKSSGLDETIVTGLLQHGSGKRILFDWIDAAKKKKTSQYHHQRHQRQGSSGETDSNGNDHYDPSAAAAASATTNPATPTIDKSYIRYVFNFVKIHHERADVSRRTMQKLNRFFMSDENDDD